MNHSQLAAIYHSAILSIVLASSAPADAQYRSSGSGNIRPSVSTATATVFQAKDLNHCVNSFSRKVKGKHQTFDVTYNCKGQVISYTTKLSK